MVSLLFTLADQSLLVDGKNRWGAKMKKSSQTADFRKSSILQNRQIYQLVMDFMCELNFQRLECP